RRERRPPTQCACKRRALQRQRLPLGARLAPQARQGAQHGLRPEAHRRQAGSLAAIQSKIASPSAGVRPGPPSRSTATWLGAAHLIPSSVVARSKTTLYSPVASKTFAPDSTGRSRRLLATCSELST